MFENNTEKSKAVIEAELAVQRAKQMLSNAKKKENEQKRKKENHHKYMMGGIIVKYLPECYLFEEKELNEILSAAVRSRECQQTIESIKKQNAGYGKSYQGQTGQPSEGRENAENES